MNTIKNKVLILDDDSSLLETLNIYLSDDFDGVSFRDPEEAFEYLFFNKVDALLMDFKFGKLDGIEVVKEFATANPTLPILVFSGDSKAKGAIQKIDNNVIQYVAKPHFGHSLSNTLRNHIDRVNRFCYC